MDSLRPYALADYLRLAGRHKLTIAVPAAIFVIASGLAIWQLPSMYESSIFVIVEAPQGSATADRPSIDIGRRLSTIRQQVTTRSGLEALIEKYGLYGKMQERGEPADNIVAAMRSDITIDVSSTRPDATDAFAISYRSPDPETARDVTTALADRLIAENLKAVQSEAAGEAEVLAERAGELSAELRGMETKSPWLMSIKEDAMPGAPPGGARVVAPSQEAVRAQLIDIGNIRDQQYKIRQQMDDMESRIAQQKQLVEKQKKSPMGRDTSSIGALLAKRAELQGQRENYVKTQGLTEKHPRVVALDDQIDSMNRAIAEVRRQEAGAATQTPEERELATLEFDRDKLRIELEVASRQLQRQISAPPESNRSFVGAPVPVIPRDTSSGRLAQDYMSLRQNYKEITASLQKAHLEAQVIQSGKVDRFRVIDKANLPETPVWPNRRLLVFISVLIGLAVGIVFFICLRLRKLTSMQDAADVEYYTGLPLLIMVPRIATAGEKALRARNRKIQLVLGTALGAIAVFALSKVLIIARLFELVVRR
jgi:succinoglycan biosynthesis transport protein ExoP